MKYIIFVLVARMATGNDKNNNEEIITLKIDTNDPEIKINEGASTSHIYSPYYESNVHLRQGRNSCNVSV